jgi:uncharacterized protein YaaR (DUF327 family)
MDGINPLINPGTAAYTAPARSEPKKAEKSKKGLFSGLLRMAEDPVENATGTAGALSTPGVVSEEVFRESVDLIFQLGEELKRKQTLDAFQEYRKRIQLFFRYVVDNGLDTGKQTGVFDYKNMKPAKEYTLIKVIDRKLEDLAVSILQGQKDNLKILEKIDEIQGLLVDLLQE